MYKSIGISLVVLLAACEFGGDGGSRTPHVRELVQLHFVEEVRLGSLEDPTLGFSRVSALAVKEDGTLYVLDGQEREVRIFDKDGQRLGTIGRSGQGPGEFVRPTSVGLAGDTLWVLDEGSIPGVTPSRISWFDSSGALVHETPGRTLTIPTDVPGVTLRVGLGAPLPSGLVGSSRIVGGSISVGVADQPYHVPVVRFDREGAIVDTVRWDTVDPGPLFRVGNVALPAPRLYPQSPLTTSWRDERIEVHWTDGGNVLRVVRLAANNDTVAEALVRYDPIPTPLHVRDSMLSRPAGIGRLLGVSDDAFAAARASALQLPDHLPPVRSVRVAADGGPWVELEGASSAVNEWLVLDASLAPRGRAALPKRAEPNYIDESTIWALELDEFDVPWLIRMRAVP